MRRQLVTAAIVLIVSAALLPSASPAQTINACVSKNGSVRIVEPGTPCPRQDTPLLWNSGARVYDADGVQTGPLSGNINVTFSVEGRNFSAPVGPGGWDGFELQEKRTRNSYGDQSEYECPDGAHRVGNKRSSMARNSHPTVKPLALARYLATLLLPPAEYAPRRLFNPFCGVASEAIGANQAGWEDVQGVELTEEYLPIARARVEYCQNKPEQKELFNGE